MNILYRFIQAVSLVVSFVSGIVLLLILVWLIGGHGVVACGRGIFDSPEWFSEVSVAVGVPLGVLAASVYTFQRCSNYFDKLEAERN